MQHTLVDHVPQHQRVIAGEDCLALDPGSDQSVYRRVTVMGLLILMRERA
jgi:hypothetical protein